MRNLTPNRAGVALALGVGPKFGELGDLPFMFTSFRAGLLP